ncbi:Ger(x)C family spore germination C-terminal domain-containing protein [Paenibacillus sp. Root444D2]|uniref:Ger(x)C family spore germination C-terminal domain-containing protein n=1 Tax=Paenibacillus sp. Root444D2 TaxID=1736538 RepID=UPI00070A9E36|nr:Ger(x)C family spore germination C-terminal domain-containing protein [Paenibacillus sp. Root444D2]KQX64659.1 hypothetical protein ASD40_02390 [Paenibacillus sp. Root444D2]
MKPLDPNKLKTYEEAVVKTCETLIINLLKKFQKANVDPLGFGLDYRAHHFGTVKEEWKAWQALYHELEFNVNIQVKLDGVGVIK